MKYLSIEDFFVYFKQSENADLFECGCGCGEMFSWSHYQAQRIKKDLLKKFKNLEVVIE